MNICFFIISEGWIIVKDDVICGKIVQDQCRWTVSIITSDEGLFTFGVFVSDLIAKEKAITAIKLDYNVEEWMQLEKEKRIARLLTHLQKEAENQYKTKTA